MELDNVLKSRLEHGLGADIAFLEQLMPFQGVPATSIPDHGIDIITQHQLPTWILKNYLARFGSDDPWDIAHNKMVLDYAELNQDSQSIRKSESGQMLKRGFFVYQNTDFDLSQPWIVGYDLAMSTAGFFGSDRARDEIKWVKNVQDSEKGLRHKHEQSLITLLENPQEMLQILESSKAQEVLDKIVQKSTSPKLKDAAAQASPNKLIGILSAYTNGSLESIARTITSAGLPSLRPGSFLAVGDEHNNPVKFYETNPDIPSHLAQIHKELHGKVPKFMSEDERKTKMSLWTMYWMQHSRAGESLVHGIKEDIHRALSLPDDHPYLEGIDKPQLRGIEDKLSSGSMSLLEAAEITSRFDTRKFRANIYDHAGERFTQDLKDIIENYGSRLPLTGSVPRGFVSEQPENISTKGWRAIAKLTKLYRADGKPLRALRAVTSKKGEVWAETAVHNLRYHNFLQVIDGSQASSISSSKIPKRTETELAEKVVPLPLDQVVSRLTEQFGVNPVRDSLAENGLYQPASPWMSPSALKKIATWKHVDDVQEDVDLARRFVELATVKGNWDDYDTPWLNEREQEDLADLVKFVRSDNWEGFDAAQESLTEYSWALRLANVFEGRPVYHRGENPFSVEFSPYFSIPHITIPEVSLRYLNREELSDHVAQYRQINAHDIDLAKKIADPVNQRLIDAAGIEFASADDQKALAQMRYGLIHKDLADEISDAAKSLPDAVTLYAHTKKKAPRFTDWANKNHMGRKGYVRHFNVPADAVDAVKSEIQDYMGRTKVTFSHEPVNM